MRQKRSGVFKSKIALEAANENKTLNEIGQKYAVHPLQVSQWKKQLIEGAAAIFSDKRCARKDKRKLAECTEALQKKVGELTMENDWLKKKLGL